MEEIFEDFGDLTQICEKLNFREKLVFRGGNRFTVAFVFFVLMYTVDSYLLGSRP